jgi:hypothetical protein
MPKHDDLQLLEPFGTTAQEYELEQAAQRHLGISGTGRPTLRTSREPPTPNCVYAPHTRSSTHS